MIDATYKTTIPLFFLTVHTNAGYTVVAEFIVQMETGILTQKKLLLY